MQTVLIAIAALIVGTAFGAIVMGLISARRVDELIEDLALERDKQDALRKLFRGVDWPLGKIHSVVATCSNQPVDKVTQVLEVLRALPGLAHALERHPAKPENCADPRTAQEWFKRLR